MGLGCHGRDVTVGLGCHHKGWGVLMDWNIVLSWNVMIGMGCRRMLWRGRDVVVGMGRCSGGASGRGLHTGPPQLHSLFCRFSTKLPGVRA